MSVRLVILGLLKNGPLHGYEIKHIIETHMDDWTNIAFGSIYFALRKMSEEGFVESTGTEQVGNRPARIVYALTDSGRTEYRRLLLEALHSEERQYYGIDVALAFMDDLNAEEVKHAFQERVEGLTQAWEHLLHHREEQMARPTVPDSARFIFAHAFHHLEAELSWAREVLESLP
jgi:DNA-binding PadR family transcriptional regulator